MLMSAQGPVFWAFCFGFGLLVGSFLNVVILRLPTRLMHDWRKQSEEFLAEVAIEEKSKNLSTNKVEIEIERAHHSSDVSTGAGTVGAANHSKPPGIVFERSHCPKCKHQLSWYENIPLMSYLIQGGKCRHCRVKISWQYPVVEFVTGVLTVFAIWKFGATTQGFAAIGFTWALIAMSGIDLRTQLLPDQLTLPLLWAGLILSTQTVFVDASTAIIGAALGYLILWSVYWLFKLATGKDGMGFGDFKLLAALGAWCGYQGLIPILLLSSFVGAIVGSIYLAIAGKNRATPIPFGQWLALGGWIQLMFGQSILDWYLNLFAR